MTSYWRRIAAPIITEVLRETAGKPESEIRAALLKAYPFGLRRHHPYRIWRDEIRIQTGRRQIPPGVRHMQGRPPEPPDQRQGALFA
jgi:hypothetical protein